MSERILRQKDYCAQEEEAVKELSSLATAVQASTTLAIDALAKQMRADGIDVIGFGAGEPDFNTPEHIKEAAIEAIRENFTKYTPSAGIMPLREAVCLRMREDCGLDYRPSQVVIASGAKHNVYIALRALVNPGDEVILPAPYWVSYYEMIKMVGGVPVVVNGLEENQFKITAQQLAQAITPRTKCLIFNNPSNPTGMVYSREELAGIARVCVEHELYVIADEIYYGLLYDGLTFTSFASLGEDIRELTILINGVSKSYAMTGWRVICRCETVTEGEILECLRAPIPPRSVDGVKRRVGAGMGRCQGGFCGPRVVELLSDYYGVAPGDILQDRAGTWLLSCRTKGEDAHV